MFVSTNTGENVEWNLILKLMQHLLPSCFISNFLILHLTVKCQNIPVSLWVMTSSPVRQNLICQTSDLMWQDGVPWSRLVTLRSRLGLVTLGRRSWLTSSGPWISSTIAPQVLVLLFVYPFRGLCCPLPHGFHLVCLSLSRWEWDSKRKEPFHFLDW